MRTLNSPESFDEGRISTQKPAIFDRPSLDWVAYAETRRTGPGMNGNFSDRPTTINPTNHALTGSNEDYEVWAAHETEKVRQKYEEVLSKTALDHIALPNPVHKTDLFITRRDDRSAHIELPAIDRVNADAILVTEPGIGSGVTPADCPVINLVNTMERSTLQIHAGYRGINSGIVRKVFNELAVANPEHYLAYISPYATKGFAVHGPVLESLTENPTVAPFVYKDGDNHYIDMGGALKRQLMNEGIPEDNIEISRENTLANPSLFSYRNKIEKGADGRNGIILGIKR